MYINIKIYLYNMENWKGDSQFLVSLKKNNPSSIPYVSVPVLVPGAGYLVWVFSMRRDLSKKKLYKITQYKITQKEKEKNYKTPFHRHFTVA